MTGLVLFVESRHPASEASGPGGPAVAPSANATAQYGKPIPMPPDALRTAQKFVQTAVLRKDAAASWAITTKAERAGFTRAQWATGNIPVVPFPREKFGSAKFKIDRSRQRDILLEVLLTSKQARREADRRLPRAGAAGPRLGHHILRSAGRESARAGGAAVTAGRHPCRRPHMRIS